MAVWVFSSVSVTVLQCQWESSSGSVGVLERQCDGLTVSGRECVCVCVGGGCKGGTVRVSGRDCRGVRAGQCVCEGGTVEV